MAVAPHVEDIDWDAVQRSLAPSLSLFLGKVPQRILGGKINRAYSCQSSVGQVVLRFYPSSRRARQIRFENEVLDWLWRQGAPVPRPFLPPASMQAWQANDGDQRLFFSVQSFCAGKPMDNAHFLHSRNAAPQMPANLLDAMVQTYHQVRQGLDGFEPPFAPVSELKVFSRALEVFWQNLSAHDPLRKLRDEVSSWQGMVDDAGLKTGVLHGDLHPGNFLWDGERALLIDFDDAHVGVLAFDQVALGLQMRWLGHSKPVLSTTSDIPERVFKALEKLSALKMLVYGVGENLWTKDKHPARLLLCS